MVDVMPEMGRKSSAKPLALSNWPFQEFAKC